MLFVGLLAILPLLVHGSQYPYRRGSCDSLSLRAAGLEPIIRIPALFHPSFFSTPRMSVSYGDRELDCGESIASGATELETAPRISLEGWKDEGNFTIVALDADMPEPGVPVSGLHLLWIVADAPLEDDGVLDVTRGVELLPYETPVVAKGDPHRIFILAFQRGIEKEENELVPGGAAAVSDRDIFDLEHWTYTGGLFARADLGFVYFIHK